MKTAPLRSSFRHLPLSWVLVVLAIFLLWMVPSIESRYVRVGDESVAAYHEASFGLLFFAQLEMRRPAPEAPWRFAWGVRWLRLLTTIALTCPVLVLGQSGWRRWQAAVSDDLARAR